MVAYSFKPQFVTPILEGTKRQTIRKPRYGRSRHACPGGPVTLLTGPRFQPTLLGRTTCTRLLRVILDFRNGGVRWVNMACEEDQHTATSAVGLDDFARGDGFQDWEAMAQFWRNTHDTDQFEGVMITWEFPFNV